MLRGEGSLCGRAKQWFLRIEFIKSFSLTSDVNWSAIEITRTCGGLWYADKAIEGEFGRFACRDMNPWFITLIYFFGCLVFYFILSWGSIRWYHPYVSVPLAGLLCIAETYWYFFRSLTAETQRIRYPLIAAIGVLCAWACSAPAEVIYENCDTGVELFGYIFGKFPLALTATRKRLYCSEIICPFPILSMNIAIIALRLRPLHHAVCVWLQYVMIMLGFLILSHPQPTNVVIIKGLWYALLVAGSCVLVIVREYLLRNQFQQTVLVHQRSLDAKRRQQEVDSLLVATLPASALNRLMRHESVADTASWATVIFSDIVQFTRWSSARTAPDVVKMLNVLCVRFDNISTSLSVEKIKTIGDAYWAVAGVPEWCPQHAVNVCEMALQMQEAMVGLNAAHQEWSGIALRIGIHSGPIAGGMPGTQRLSYEVFGPTSHIAEEVEQAGQPCRVAVSETTHELVSSEFYTEEYGKLEVGPDEMLRLFLIFRCNPRQARDVEVVSIDQQGPAGPCQVRSEPSAVPSLGPADPAVGGDTDAARRAHFLKARGLRRKSVKKTAGGVETPRSTVDTDEPEVTAKLKERKYRFLLLRFKDDEQEAHFIAFAAGRTRPMRLAARFVQLVFMLWVVGSQFAEGPGLSTAAGAGLIAASILLWASCAAWVLLVDRFCVVEELFQFVALLLLIVGCGQVPEGIAVNDTTYLVAVSAASLACANVCIPSVVQAVLVVALLDIPALIVNFRAYLYFVNFMFYVTLTVMCYAITFTNERFLRQQFVEEEIAVYLQQVIENQHAIQRDLLLSIVPEYIVPPLLEWFAAGLSLDRSIAKRYPHVAVGFMKIDSDAVLAEGFASPFAAAPSSPAGAMSAADSHRWGDSPAAKADPNPGSPTGSPLNSLGAADAHMRHLLLVHRCIDRLASRFSTVDKIKTIGDLVMFAGPFAGTGAVDRCETESRLAVGRAVGDIIGIFSSMCRELKNIPLWCGVHTGEVVGAVIGTKRLSFDVFGDTVNTASRAMATSQPRKLALTVAAKDALLAATVEASTSANWVVGQPVGRTAKGKGTIEVCEIDFSHVQCKADEDSRQMC